MELYVHLQDLDRTDLLEVMAYFQALFPNILLSLSEFKHLQVIFHISKVVVYFFFTRVFVQLIQGSIELVKDRMAYYTHVFQNTLEIQNFFLNILTLSIILVKLF